MVYGWDNALILECFSSKTNPWGQTYVFVITQNQSCNPSSKVECQK